MSLCASGMQGHMDWLNWLALVLMVQPWLLPNQTTSKAKCRYFQTEAFKTVLKCQRRLCPRSVHSPGMYMIVRSGCPAMLSNDGLTGIQTLCAVVCESRPNPGFNGRPNYSMCSLVFEILASLPKVMPSAISNQQASQSLDGNKLIGQPMVEGFDAPFAKSWIEISLWQSLYIRHFSFVYGIFESPILTESQQINRLGIRSLRLLMPRKASQWCDESKAMGYAFWVLRASWFTVKRWQCVQAFSV